MKCGYCKEEGHTFNGCNNYTMNNIYKDFKNEISTDIIFNLTMHINIINFMYQLYNEINHKYMYLYPIGSYVKKNLEKIIKKRNLMEKKVLSKFSYLPTSYSQNYLTNQLTDEYFKIFNEEFEKKEPYLKIIFDNNLIIENIFIYLKNDNLYNDFDMLLIVVLLINICEYDIDNIINIFFEKYNDIKEFKNNTNYYNNLLKTIKSLKELGYDFKYESVYYNNNLKIDVIKDLTNSINDNEICPICYENIEQNRYMKTDCLHIYCYDCFDKIKKNREPYNNLICALCRTNIDKINKYI